MIRRDRPVPSTGCRLSFPALQSNPQPNSLAPLLPEKPNRKRGLVAGREGQWIRIGGNSEQLLCASSPLLFFPSTRQSQREEEEEGSLCFICALPHVLTHFWIPRAHQNRIRAALGRRCGDGGAGSARLVAVPLPRTAGWSAVFLLRSTHAVDAANEPWASLGRGLGLALAKGMLLCFNIFFSSRKNYFCPSKKGKIFLPLKKTISSFFLKGKNISTPQKKKKENYFL